MLVWSVNKIQAVSFLIYAVVKGRVDFPTLSFSLAFVNRFK